MFSLASMISYLSRPYGACVKCGSGKHMFGLSLFRLSRQSNISTSGEERFKYPLPWENKISQMPYPRASKDNLKRPVISTSSEWDVCLSAKGNDSCLTKSKLSRKVAPLCLQKNNFICIKINMVNKNYFKSKVKGI